MLHGLLFCKVLPWVPPVCSLQHAASEIPLAICPKICNVYYLLPLYQPENRPIQLNTQYMFLGVRYMYQFKMADAYANVPDVQLSPVSNSAKSDTATMIFLILRLQSVQLFLRLSNNRLYMTCQG